MRLASAQLVLAREHGHPSWPALLHAAEARADRVVVVATSGRRARAEALLAARPELEHDRWVRLVRGRGWDGDANEVGGPRGWAPLHYVCHSCWASVELARQLLERGADPNRVNDRGQTALGAAVFRRSAESVSALLAHGADPHAGGRSAVEIAAFFELDEMTALLAAHRR